MLNVGFVFYHGFGFDISYWNNLAPMLKDFPCAFYDAGYYKNPQNPENYLKKHAEVSWVGVGHSIGFMKLLEKHKLEQIKLSGIIGLQSFENFLGHSPTLRKIRTANLDAILEGFKNNPEDSLRDFIVTCNPTSNPYTKNSKKIHDISELDTHLLTRDLNLLKNKIVIPNDLPHLIIASHEDPVVDKLLVKDNFLNSKYSDIQYNVRFVKCHRHSLGYDNTKDIISYFMKFVENDFKVDN